MVMVAYVSFVFIACLAGAVLGWIGHYMRAHTTFAPEDLGLGEPWNTLTRDDYQFEKNVVGAEWDDNGYWDDLSNRNLVYYVASGAATPLLVGLFLWSDRALLVDATCRGFLWMGLSPLVCPA